jgi:hypothetical protein
MAQNQLIKTLGDCLYFMATFAGGSIPSDTDDEYGQWVRWIGVKQEEYATRGFWRRLLTPKDITLTADITVLPDNFHKPNGVYVLEVGDEDWAEASPTPKIFVNMDTDSDSANYGKWVMHMLEETDETEAKLWYFANPKQPTTTSDLLLLPGDMIAYGALSEYFRQANQEGSQDDARLEAENRLQEYLSLEIIPPRYELLSHTPKRVDRLDIARGYYKSRPDRNTQL